MMRYLQHDAIRGKGLAHFDCWASTFGETQTAIELAPEGTGYRARTRFAKFFNLPELMTLFKEAADIKTSDQLNLPTPTPIQFPVAARLYQRALREYACCRSGLKKGDIILSIDDEDMTNKEVSYVSDNLRGDPGSSFMLKVKNGCKWQLY